jgi:hypothetical protein
MIRSLAAALGVYDAYNGLVPPNWGDPIPKRLQDDEDVFAFLDEVIYWDVADYDDYYCGVDPALCTPISYSRATGLRARRATATGTDERSHEVTKSSR